jgi:hypothetical protein
MHHTRKNNAQNIYGIAFKNDPEMHICLFTYLYSAFSLEDIKIKTKQKKS